MACLSPLLHYMKNTADAEELRDLHYMPFAEMSAGAIEIVDPRKKTEDEDASVRGLLDHFVTAVKWVFLFLPGCGAIHVIMLGFSLLYYYEDWTLELAISGVGILIFGAFMVMAGIGKLGDLRYLRVPASLIAAGALASVVYSLLVLFIPGDFFGDFARLTLPFSVLIGYMVKRDTDKKFNSE